MDGWCKTQHLLVYGMLAAALGCALCALVLVQVTPAGRGLWVAAICFLLGIPLSLLAWTLARRSGSTRMRRVSAALALAYIAMTGYALYIVTSVPLS